MRVRSRQLVALTVVVIAAVSLIAIANGARERGRAGPGKGTLHGSIDLTDQTWWCTGRVDLTSVTVTMDAAAQALPRSQQDAVHLGNGCTGHIGTVTIVQYAADGIKVGNGVHDLVIGGGSIRCLDKAPVLHQDGIQVMSGRNITFANISIDCGRPGETLVNSDLFINQGTSSWPAPTNVVCDHCQLGADAAHTANIQASIGSGLRNSTLCPALFPSLTLTIGPAAVNPVNTGNQLVACDTSTGTSTTSPATGPTQPVTSP